MKLITMVNTFARDEDGAVTVDWVVLATFGDATEDYADTIGAHISSQGVTTDCGN